MKTFVRNIIFLLIPVMLFAVLADYVVTKGLQQSGDQKYQVWNEIYRGNIDADLVVLGSSRAWTAYNTYMLDSLLGINSYNLGIDGLSVYAQILRYNTYIRFNTKPKAVLLNVDFMSTFSNSAPDAYQREQFLPYIADDSLITAIESRAIIRWTDRYIPFCRYARYRKDVANGVKNIHTPPRVSLYKGFAGQEREWNRGSLDDKEMHRFIRGIEEEKCVEYFLKKCKDDGIQVVLVKEPVYYELFQTFIGIEECDSIFADLAQRYNAEIIDLYHDSISLSNEYFYNPSHLNAKGAEAFTRKLCAELKNIGIE